MENEFPKRLFRLGNEPQVEHINNRCKFSVMKIVEGVLTKEYKEVMEKSVFAHILAINENDLGYSARLIHSMISRQLVTKKRKEIWFVFGGRPLRFSLQEFVAITWLKYKNDHVSIDDADNSKDDGFWSNLLKEKKVITIKRLLDNHLEETKEWEPVDRVRFVYVYVIASVIMARDVKARIPHKYIKLVINTKMLESYPWGRDAFECLIKSIHDAQDKLKNPTYVLDGFSYAFQIWAFEAIPSVGYFVGRKKTEELIESPPCSNWTGALAARRS